jgi:ubiquinone/menaquinone biosynthesis C-methylase UbiE
MQVTHETVLVEKKPSDEQIRILVRDYFEAEAKHYDTFNSNTEKRKLFINSVDEIVARYIEKTQSKQILTIACGTGNREVRIESLAGKQLDYVGVDISAEMCRQATRAGINTINSDWLAANLGNKIFDSVFYLHAFGLVPSRAARILELKKINQHLEIGGRIYLDVMNLSDQYEWGPDLKKQFERLSLEKRGYEKGDVFYRRIGAAETSYFHYFEEAELESLFNNSGFIIKNRHYIGCGQYFGKEVGSQEGAILVIAEKTKAA